MAGGNRVLPDLARSGDTDSLLLARLPDCHDAVHLWWLGELPEAQLVAGLTGLLWIMHWPNISRLLAGAENKIGKPTASLKREPALSAVLAGDDPEAVVLDFMQPQRAEGGLGAFIGRQG